MVQKPKSWKLRVRVRYVSGSGWTVLRQKKQNLRRIRLNLVSSFRFIANGSVIVRFATASRPTG